MLPQESWKDIPNAAIDLYEIGVDLLFERDGRVVLDSSLGVLREEEERTADGDH